MSALPQFHAQMRPQSLTPAKEHADTRQLRPDRASSRPVRTSHSLPPHIAMSISDTPTPPTTQAAKTTTSSTSLAAEDEEELRKLDQVYKRISTNIPDTPYIITVPCAEPRYHHWSREQAESWCRNTPFDPSEERLQYMSFLYRDHADSCFVCRTEVDEERDRRAAMKTKSAPSGTSTPRSDVPKKKISLAAYSKSKQANGLPPKPGSGQDQVKKETPVSESRNLPEKSADAQKSIKKEKDDISL